MSAPEETEIDMQIKAAMLLAAFRAINILVKTAVYNSLDDHTYQAMSQGILFYAGYLEITSMNNGKMPEGLSAKDVCGVGADLIKLVLTAADSPPKDVEDFEAMARTTTWLRSGAADE